jgi:drug/metabolite transporter (DMT)-like permease
MFLPFLILIRIVSNPLSNLFQKKLVTENANSLFIIFVTYCLLSIASLPLLKQILSSNLPFDFFAYMTLCAALSVLSNTLLVKALNYSDLSLLGPINSYKPVVGMIGGIILLWEIPSMLGLLGVAFIVFGSYFIADNDTSKKGVGVFARFIKDKGVQLRFAALILSGVEAVFMKKAMMYSSPLNSMVMWCFFGFIISGIATMFIIKKGIAAEFSVMWKKKLIYLFLFITTGLMQLSTFFVFKQMNVGYALALFQTSTLLSVFFGYKYFNEKNIRKRAIGSLFMIFGSVLIIIFSK